MKPRDKERLVKYRGPLVQTLDVELIIPYMRQKGTLTKSNETKVMQDPRRRQRVLLFLDMLEHRKTEVYLNFLEALEEFYPHLYLLLNDWGDAPDDPLDEQWTVQDDEWTTVRRSRKFLIREIDAKDVIGQLVEKAVISDSEEKRIMTAASAERRTETMLDILETKSGNACEFFLDAVSSAYPHVYLMMTNPEDQFDDL